MIPSLTSKINLIESEINQLHFPKQPNNLYEPIRYFLSLGGKRMRPVLLLMGHELFGGNAKDVIKTALAIELFHNFTLIHDDIMDHAKLRRGKATVHEKWNQHIGILSGDAMLVYAYRLLGECPEKNYIQLHQIFNRVALEVCEGQQYDMDFEKTSITMNQYLEMIRLKTSVLLGSALEMGAVLAQANEVDARNIYEFGEHLGIAFQIQDDLLDAYGDPDKFGKLVGGDIIANKKTYLLVAALQEANSKQHEKINLLLNGSEVNDEQKIKSMLTLYDELNIREKTQEEMNKHFKIAMHKLNLIAVEENKKTELKLLAEHLLIRVH